MFAKYHYLSHYHNNAARVFIATINDEVCGFCSVLHLPHPKARNIKKVHRLVVLPDYQGIGIGIRLLNEVGRIIISEGYRFTIRTSSPSLVFGLKKDKSWRCLHYGRNSPHKGLGGVGHPGSSNRLATSWELTLQTGGITRINT
jgi:GNAT superfamily N-acetyltransferase